MFFARKFHTFAAEAVAAERERLYKIVRSSDPPTQDPRPPSGGMQVGMEFVVSQRDWFARQLLVRALRPVIRVGRE